jgi:hypothetical protein
MFRRRLLRLYPRAWRARYGEEFLAMLGSNRLRPSQVIDIVRGAIDARLSMDARRVLCAKPRAGVTALDGLIGAGIMLGASFVFATLMVVATKNGWTGTSHALKDMAFPVPFVISMPFWLMKGTNWKAQTAIVGGTLAILVVISALSHAAR